MVESVLGSESARRRVAPAPALGSAAGPALLIATAAAGALFLKDGFLALFEAWQAPEYSHGPLIPVLSGLLFLRHLRSIPPETGPVADRWPGVAVIALALLVGALGRLARIPDITAYAIIVFVAGLILVSFGWRRGVGFWPAVVHLAFMLPLPGILYWKVSTSLQLFSSEVGVALIRALGVPVYLDGNIIDLGIYKLHVAEACSGLRYLYPIMSFSYIFAALYRGPVWHKAILLLSAAPITVMMNSVRIGMIGVIVHHFGISHAEGLSHLLEGWVIFLASVALLFALVRLMLWTQDARMSLSEALDLDLSGVGPQAMRLRFARPSLAMAAGFVLSSGAALAWSMSGGGGEVAIARDPLAVFPREVGEWRRISTETLEPRIERVLGADDYLSASFVRDGAPVEADLFIAWYRDQTAGGIHSPEVCLPGGGWEMADIRRVDIGPDLGLSEPLPVNRAVIQKGEARLLVFYWFEQYAGRTASDYRAKVELIRSAVLHGRSDGALVRLVTPILPDERIEQSERRLLDLAGGVVELLPRFVPRA